MKKILILLLILALSVSCSSDKKNLKGEDTYEVGYGDKNVMQATEAKSEEAVSDSGEKVVSDEKIIGISSIYVSTTEFDKDSEYLLELNKSFEGKIDFIAKNKSDYSGLEVLNLTLRIPSDKMDQFMNSLRDRFPDHMREETTKSNVTMEYRESETRIKVLEDKLKRLRELLAKAEEISDILEIENNISYTIEEIEIQKGSLKYLEDQIQYSTAYIELKETKSHAPSQSNASFTSKVSQAFKDMGFIFVNTMKTLIITLIYAIPYIILILIGRFVYLKFLKKRLQKKKKVKKEEDDV